MGIDELDDNGLSALHYAARFNHYDAVMLLVKEGKACKLHPDLSASNVLSALELLATNPDNRHWVFYYLNEWRL